MESEADDRASDVSRQYVHGTGRFRELIFGGIGVLVGVQVLVFAGTTSLAFGVVGLGLIVGGCAVAMRGRRLGLWIDADRVVVRRFLFSLPFALDDCRLVIDDDQAQTSIQKFALLEITGQESQFIHQISWSGKWATAPRLIQVLKDIEAAGLTVERRSL